MTGIFSFACPECCSPLALVGADLCICPACGAQYRCENGVWLFLPAKQQQVYGRFMEEYHRIRIAEKRGAPDPAYYRELPFRDLSGQFTTDWKIRAASFRKFLQAILVPLERNGTGSLIILDLGAGNGWLSYRLSQRGHAVAAIDLQTDKLDGLGAHIHYNSPFLPLQADFNHLPLCDSQADLVIFNASFHYSIGYASCLREALRALRSDGQVVILDSPIYHDARNGVAMVREREAHFREIYGFPSDAIQSENFLTYSRLKELGEETGIQWRHYAVNYGLAWALRPLRARLAGKREPAQFRLIAGRRRESHPQGG